MSSFLTALPWILPPVLGAVIGYVTNAIAIRMLFRPLREIRIAGVKLPFTPGIIPKQRYELAESIGRMVSNELLTEDALRRQIEAPSFSKGVKQSVESLTSKLLGFSLSELFENIGSSLGDSSVELVRELLASFIESDAFGRVVSAIMDKGFKRFTSYTVGDLLPTSEARESLIEGIITMFSTDEGKEKMQNQAETWVGKHIEENTPLRNFVSESVVDQVMILLDTAFGPLSALLLRWLRSDEMLKQLEVRGKFLLQDILDKLTAFQKIILSASQYDRTLASNMDRIVTDVLVSLEETLGDPETKKQLLQTVEKTLSELRGLGISDIDEKFGLDLRDRVRGGLDGIYKITGSVETGDSIRKGVRSLIDRVEERKIEELLEKVLDVDDAAAFLADFTIDRLRLSSKGISAGGLSFLKSLLDDMPGDSLEEIIGISEERKANLDDAITGSIIGLVNTRIPDIIGSIDIYDLVVSKVNGLKIEDVEALLMRVIHRHLRWINVFGAILGFLIGLTQLIIRIIL